MSLGTDAAPSRPSRPRESASRRRARRERFLKFRRAINNDFSVAGLTGVIGVILILLALPRISAELLSVGAQVTLERVRSGKTTEDGDLAQAAKDIDNANRIDSHDARRLTDRGLLYYMEAERQGLATESGKANLQASMKSLEEGLAQNPANSFAWTRLAAARLERDGGPSPGALRALRMSYLTGPYVDDLMPGRAQISLRLWERLDSELKTFATRELTYLWTDGVWEHEKILMETVCRYNRAFVLAQALRDSAAGTAEFDRLYPYFMTPDACKENAAKEKRPG